ncbi:MAG: dihydrofolate reductase family protein [Thermoplasmata archaeon]
MKNRPVVTINCAASADGRVALPDRKQATLSCKEDFWRVHKMRANSDAILVGLGTVLSDDPKLTVSSKYYVLEAGEKNPVRVVLDSRGRTPRSAMVMNEMSRTIIATSNKVVLKDLPPHVVQLDCGDEIEEGKVNLEILLDKLFGMGIRRLMVEGGPTVIASFLKKGLFDFFYIYFSPVVFGGGPPIAEDNIMSENFKRNAVWNITRLKLERVENLGEGFVAVYIPYT